MGCVLVEAPNAGAGFAVLAAKGLLAAVAVKGLGGAAAAPLVVAPKGLEALAVPAAHDRGDGTNSRAWEWKRRVQDRWWEQVSRSQVRSMHNAPLVLLAMEPHPRQDPLPCCETMSRLCKE